MSCLQCPELCQCAQDTCIKCKEYQSWKKNFNETVDDIVERVNLHKCKRNGCLKNKYGTCKARFPRQVFKSTMFDPETGAICMKKHEAYLNTFNPILIFQRCNSDATSLLSGTAIKSTIAYVTDYITKSSLNTHVIFDAVRGDSKQNA